LTSSEALGHVASVPIWRPAPGTLPFKRQPTQMLAHLM
jgi:hypothetical protein